MSAIDVPPKAALLLVAEDADGIAHVRHAGDHRGVLLVQLVGPGGGQVGVRLAAEDRWLGEVFDRAILRGMQGADELDHAVRP